MIANKRDGCLRELTGLFFYQERIKKNNTADNKDDATCQTCHAAAFQTADDKENGTEQEKNPAVKMKSFLTLTIIRHYFENLLVNPILIFREHYHFTMPSNLR